MHKNNKIKHFVLWIYVCDLDNNFPSFTILQKTVKIKIQTQNY